MEVLVALSLTMFLLASLIPVVRNGALHDVGNDEEMTTFMAAVSRLESLQVPANFTDFLDQCGEWTNAAGTVVWAHTNGLSLAGGHIPATEFVVLEPGDVGGVSHYTATVTVIWNGFRQQGTLIPVTNTVVGIIH